MSKAILVTGATGKQGGAVIKALLAHSAAQKSGEPAFQILAVTRSTSSASASSLAAKSPLITLVEGDLDAVPALFEAATKKATSGKIWGVFSVQVSMGKGVTFDGEIKQGKAMVDAALEHGVQQFVYSSVDRGGSETSWDVETPIPHFQTKHIVEQYLREKVGPSSGMSWTILRPTAFMDNFEPGYASRVFLAALKNNIPTTKPIQWIATSDIGIIATKIFTSSSSTSTYHNRAISIAGDSLTVAQISQAFKNGADADIQPAPWFLGSVLTTLVGEMGTMVRWFGKEGYGADLAEVRSVHPEVKSFETWVREESKFTK